MSGDKSSNSGAKREYFNVLWVLFFNQQSKVCKYVFFLRRSKQEKPQNLKFSKLKFEDNWK